MEEISRRLVTRVCTGGERGPPDEAVAGMQTLSTLLELDDSEVWVGP